MTKTRKKANQLVILLKGKPEDEDHVRLSDFIAQLESFRRALMQTDRIISGGEKPTAYYRVVDLHHSSPAMIAIEAVPYNRKRGHVDEIMGRFVSGLRLIQEKGELPQDYDRPALEAMKDLAARLNHSITEVFIDIANESVQVTKGIEGRIEQIIGTDETMEGSLEGHLDSINVHNKTNLFHLYSTLGPKKVSCHFVEAKKKEALAAVGQYVNVSGTLKYKKKEHFPYAIDVASIEVYPSEDKLPLLSDLRGIAPGATGRMKSEDFVRSLRHGEE
jgi:hypothetical protein